ncbi:hypothetical protein [Herbidospora sp. RD11066]
MRLLHRIRAWWRSLGATPERKAPPSIGGRHVCEEPEPNNPIKLARGIMQPPPRPCSHPAGEGVHILDDAFTITTPAQGDALPFHVTVHATWCAQYKTSRSGRDLHAEVDAKRVNVQRRIHDVIRATARTFPPFQPDKAEEQIEKELAVALYSPVHDCDEITITISTRTWVMASEEVLASRRTLSLQLLDDHNKLELTQSHVWRLNEERELWLTFLSACESHWRSRFAVHLAEHPVNVADVMGRMQSERRDEADRYITLVQNVVSAQQAVNVFDLVVQSDTMLRRALESLGIPVPDLVTDLPWEQS